MQPTFAELAPAVRAAADFLDRAAAARGSAYVNSEGGDVGMHGSRRSVVRHVAHYLAAAELAAAAGLAGAPVLDLGCGVAGLSAWLAQRLGSPLFLADHDRDVLAVACAAFPDASVVDDLADRSGWVGLVTAMEVIEHLPPAQHEAFVSLAFQQLRPGGLLVVSTPDETRYPGGWSGYAPHVGCVDAAELRRLLETATGRPATVWRLEGEPFDLTPVRAWTEAGLNRVWGWLGANAPGVVARLGGGASKVAPSHVKLTAAPLPDDVRAVAPQSGQGTGMLGIVAAA